MRLDPVTRRRLLRARQALEEAAVPDALASSGASRADLMARHPSIARVARDAGLSPFHFVRLFAAAFGTTPHQHRIAARIDRAKALLASGRGSVTEVCFEVGFSSLGSFSTAFARRVGEPPSVYARRVRVLAPSPADLVRVLAPSCFGLLACLPRGALVAPSTTSNFREARPRLVL